MFTMPLQALYYTEDGRQAKTAANAERLDGFHDVPSIIYLTTQSLLPLQLPPLLSRAILFHLLSILCIARMTSPVSNLREVRAAAAASRCCYRIIRSKVAATARAERCIVKVTATGGQV